MKVHVTLLREGGQRHTPQGPRHRMAGDLLLRHERMSPHEERTVPVLRILGAAGPALYEPRLIAVFVDTIKFSGLERVGEAWYAQEWQCELIP